MEKYRTISMPAGKMQKVKEKPRADSREQKLENYPVVVPKKRRVTQPQKSFAFGLLCAIAGGAFHLWSAEGRWISFAITVLGILAGASVAFLSVLRFAKNHGFYTLLCGGSLCLLGIVADQAWNGGDLSGTMVLPGAMGLTHAVILLLCVVHRENLAQFNIYVFISALLSLCAGLVSVLLFQGAWIAVISIVLSVVALAVLFSAGRRQMIRELIRRMHL